MIWQFTPFSLPLLLGTCLSIFLAIFCWQRRPAPVAIPITILMLTTGVWMLAYVLQLSSADLSGKIFWGRIKYIGIVAAPTFWLIVALIYTGHQRWLTIRFFGLLTIEPILFFTLLWTNATHKLVYTQIQMKLLFGVVVRDATHGPVFWIHTAYSYLLVVLGTFFLLKSIGRSEFLFRKQNLAILFALLLPWIGNILYVSKLSPIPYLDPTPFSLMLSALCFYWGIFRYSLGDIIPSARDSVLENMNQGIIVLDRLNRIIDINPAAQRILDRPLSLTQGMPITQMMTAYSDILSHPSETYETSMEVRLRPHDDVIYQMHLSPFRNPKGQVLGRLIVLRDITERKQYEAALQQARAELEKRVAHRTAELTESNRQLMQQIDDRKKAEKERRSLEAQLLQAKKMEILGTLAGGVAHDLNNILSGIVSYPELILMEMPPNSPFRKPLQKVQEAGEKAAIIVQDLLTLSRRGVSTTEVINLNQIISDYLQSPEFHQLKLSSQKIRIKTRFEPVLHNMIGSSVHVGKMVMNLVNNAAEAMPQGGNITIATQNRYIDKPVEGHPHVSIGDCVVLTISDNGMGMDQEELQKIFEPFYSKKTMGRSGTGLGMTVVWGTVRDHQGYVDIESAPGEGTTIMIHFPATREEPAQHDAQLNFGDINGNGEKILVVDDIAEQREIASGILKKIGYDVYTASNGEEAVEFLKHRPIDLLVLDMIMEPGIDGLETYKRIRLIHPGQKAVIASGFSETERILEAKRLGVGSYIKKPYAVETLGRAVRTELDK